MERYHGSIWIRPAARSSGKIVSLCCPQFSFDCVDRIYQVIKNYISETSIIPLVVSPWYQGDGTVALPLLPQTTRLLNRLEMIEGNIMVCS